VNSITYSGQNEVMQGFKEHFSNLATLDKNQFHGNKYHQLVEKEILGNDHLTWRGGLWFFSKKIFWFWWRKKKI